MKGRMRFIDAEPCSVSADIVADLLEQLGWERSARFIRELGTRAADEIRKANEWRALYWEMLDKYEPEKPEGEPVSYRATPRSSD